MINLDSIKFLGLPIWKYAICGSWILSVLWIRESDDIDILVSDDLFEILMQKYPKRQAQATTSKDLCLVFKDEKIEIVKEWLFMRWRKEEIIKTADTINWFPFMNLEYLKERKSKMWRDKDKKDLELIKNYEDLHK